MAKIKRKQDSLVPRWRTAIGRTGLSRPSRFALQFGLYNKSETILDYGCGRGFDVAVLRGQGFAAKAWDPHFFPDNPKPKSDTVNIGFVLNVIEDRKERRAVLKDAFNHARKRLIVSVRPDAERKMLPDAKPYGDGILTSTGTFQKFFGRDELGQYLADNAGIKPYLVDSGIAVIFKDKAAEKDFLRQWAVRHPGKAIRPYAPK